MKVLVVGAGLAGVVAAARARTLGVTVRVIADRPGATLLHGGGWLVGGAALLGQGLPLDRLDEALAFARDGLPDLALSRGPFLLHDVLGARRPTDVAPLSHAAAAGLPPSMAVADLRGLGHPFAEMQPTGAPVAVDWPRWPGAFGRSFAAAAQRIEAEPAEFEALAQALVRAVAGRAFGGLLLPPVLGVTGVEQRRAALADRLGMPVAEALDALPSTPGLRLHRALQAWLAELGIEVRHDRVVELAPDRALLRTADGTTESADAIVLATGGRLPGTLDAGRTAHDVLPVHPALPEDPRTAIRRTGPYDGRLFRAGVPVDERLRPLDHDGAPLHRSLFACGDLVAGPDPLVTHCASGRAVLGGYLAGEAAAKGLPR